MREITEKTSNKFRSLRTSDMEVASLENIYRFKKKKKKNEQATGDWV